MDSRLITYQQYFVDIMSIFNLIMKQIIVTLYLIFIYLSFNSGFSQNPSSLDFLNRILTQTEIEGKKNFERLSSGTLLWTDDPASKAIYEKLKTHIDYLSVTIRNGNDLTSYYQTRDGYLDVITSALQRIRELILMKSNSIYGDDEMELINLEIKSQYIGILKTLSWAQFNTKPLFTSWMEDPGLQQRFKAEEFYTLSGLDRILSSVLIERSKQGALLKALEFNQQGQSIEQENSTAFLSQGDTDFATELSNLKRNEVLFLSDLFLLKRELK